MPLSYKALDILYVIFYFSGYTHVQQLKPKKVISTNLILYNFLVTWKRALACTCLAMPLSIFTLKSKSPSLDPYDRLLKQMDHARNLRKSSSVLCITKFHF